MSSLRNLRDKIKEVLLDNVNILLPAGFSYILGLMEIEDTRLQPSPESLRNEIETFCERLLARISSAQAADLSYQRGRRDAVRRFLRQGSFKPSGRNRPANEFLLRQLLATSSFNFISNLVDINNFLSLKYFLPMSVLDRDKFANALVIRLGQPGEQYVFNPSGHEISLEGLIVVAGGDVESSIPLGSPVKDSMVGKISPDTTSALAVIYAPLDEVSEREMESILSEWSGLTKRFAGASSHRSLILKS